MSSQRIFITGGASGLGKAIATYYAKKSWKVAIGDINSEALNQTKVELSQYTDHILALDCNTKDLSSLESAKGTLEEEWQGIDILVNNAGIAGTYGNVESIPIDDWERVIDINLYGVLNGCRVFAPMLKRQTSGAIVNIASMAGVFNPPNASAYNVSKAGVIALSETLKYEMLPFSVQVHAVCPAFFKTNLTQSMTSSAKAKAFVDREMEKSTISADDIAHMIAQQVEQNSFLLLPHKKERRLARLKRLLPRLYDKLAAKAFKKILKKNQIESK